MSINDPLIWRDTKIKELEQEIAKLKLSRELIWEAGKELKKTNKTLRSALEVARKVSDFVKHNEYPEPNSNEQSELTRLLDNQEMALNSCVTKT